MNPSRWFRTCMAALATLAAAPSCLAAPVSYDEAVGGDLSRGDESPLALFALDVGVNTVRGTFGGSWASLDLDSFAFTVAAGNRLTSPSMAALLQPITFFR